MLAGLLRINLPDVSGLRDFLRPGRGAKRPLEGASSSQPAPAKRASTAECARRARARATDRSHVSPKAEARAALRPRACARVAGRARCP